MKDLRPVLTGELQTRHGGAERLETKTDCWISCLDQVGGNVPSPLTAIDLVASKPTSTSTYIALLRGINVGGRNRLSMNALSKMFEDAGFADVSYHNLAGGVAAIHRGSKPVAL